MLCSLRYSHRPNQASHPAHEDEKECVDYVYTALQGMYIITGRDDSPSTTRSKGANSVNWDLPFYPLIASSVIQARTAY